MTAAVSGRDRPFADPVAERAHSTPDRLAVVDTDRGTRLTYRAYDERVEAVAAGLAARGIDRLGVVLEPSPAFAFVCFGAMRTGTTLVPLSLRETRLELDEKCDRADVDAIVCGPETADRALELSVERVVSVDPVDRPDVGLLLASDEAAGGDEPRGTRESDGSKAPDGWNASDGSNGFDDPDPFVLMFTSGTSGDPKIVRLTAGNLLASATTSAYRLGVHPDDRWLCCLPMYHMGGLSPVVRSAQYGTTIVIQRTFDPVATARILDEHSITGVSLVPTMVSRLLDEGWSPPPSLRFVLLGGAPASPELLDRSLDAGVPVYPTYGMTETASQVATATPEQVERYPGTVGQALSGTRVTVVDRSGTPLPPGERGELVVAGPTVSPGYLDETQTEAAFGEHGLHTGDVGYRDEGGRLWIERRLSDLIVSGGENVDPVEVADVLLDHSAVDGAAVVGLPDQAWGERVGALLVPAEGHASLTIESIIGHCDGRLAGFKRPRTVAFTEELPLTASGTVDRTAVRDRLRSDGVDC